MISGKEANLLPEKEREILEVLKEPMPVGKIAKLTGMSKQLVSYYMKRMLSRGLVKVAYKDISGNVISKHYVRTSDIFYERFDNGRDSPEVEGNAVIILGSPDPHGENMVGSRDLIAAAKIGQIVPAAKVTYDVLFGPHLASGTIFVVGGPLVNKSYNRFGFPEFRGRSFRVGKVFKSRLYGLISSRQNPYHPEERAICVAGNTSHGTLAAVEALRNRKIFKKAMKGNIDIIVAAKDLDNDGVVDSFGVVHESKRRRSRN